MPHEDPRYTVKELAERAGVTTRTVYYYVGEGLLPRPEGGGPASAYTDDHLARLHLIRRLKDEYLPLAEIRRRLAGLSIDVVNQVLAEPTAAPEGSARDYLARLLGTSRPPPASPEQAPNPAAAASAPRKPSVLHRALREPTEEDWRRIRIDRDLELHVRRDADARLRRNLPRIVEAIRRILGS